MSKIFIQRHSIAVLSPYFKEHEFFCKCPDYKANYHIPFDLTGFKGVDQKLVELHKELGAVSYVEMGSYFDLNYSLVSARGDILSLKLKVASYHDGAAHPFQFSRTFTFNLATGHQVNLDQLFLPGMNYLQVLSDYCKTELERRDIAFGASSIGADPNPDNYRNWNISADGLEITFDEYQVAAYAAGPQVVIIPYAKLAGVIDLKGPLEGYLPKKNE